MSANINPPKIFLDLVDANDLPRELYVPELHAVLEILQSGLLHPYPGIEIDYKEVACPNSSSVGYYYICWTINLKNKVAITIKSTVFNGDTMIPPLPTAQYIEFNHVERIDTLEELLG